MAIKARIVNDSSFLMTKKIYTRISAFERYTHLIYKQDQSTRSPMCNQFKDVFYNFNVP